MPSRPTDPLLSTLTPLIDQQAEGSLVGVKTPEIFMMKEPQMVVESSPNRLTGNKDTS